jgi:hypothetical protein
MIPRNMTSMTEGTRRKRPEAEATAAKVVVGSSSERLDPKWSFMAKYV